MAVPFGAPPRPIILGIVGDSAAAQAPQNDDAHLNVRLTLHGTLPHPDLSQIIEEDRSGCVRSALGREEVEV